MGWESDLLSLTDSTARVAAKYHAPTVEIATVLTPMPEVKIKLRDLEIPRKLIYLSEFLLEHDRQADLYWSHDFHPTPRGGPVPAMDTRIHFLDLLKAGDRVLVLPFAERQQYVILCKVVKA